MATPQYGFDTAVPLSGAPPLFEIPRRWAPRIWLLILVLPLALLCLAGSAIGIFAMAQDGFTADGLVGPIVGIGLGVLFLALFAWRFWAESARRAAFYEEGIELTTYRGSSTIRFRDVNEIGFFAQKIQAGGLLFIAGRAILEKIRGPSQLQERGYNIRLTLKTADGRKLVLTNYDKGVFRAWQEAMTRVNPRLIADVVRRARNGERVTFGKNAVTISANGLAFGKKAETPWTSIESVSIVNGRLGAKITGKWLSSGAMISQIPNLFVLTAAIVQLSGGIVQMNVQPGTNLAVGVNL